MTLIQTGKAPRCRCSSWSFPAKTTGKADRFIREQLLGRKLISQRDLLLYKVVHTPEEAVEYIKHFYSTYNSLRFVRDRVVIRLEHELSDDAVHAPADEFADLVKKGTVEKTRALPEETNEPELLDKPRLVFALNRQSPSRLYEMVLKINEVGKSK
jgi:hypothetical protein